jgi:hypothetical protein
MTHVISSSGENMAYTYYFKGTYYFRKIIHKKHLPNRTHNLNYRRSLRLCMDKDFYYFLEVNKLELDKLVDYINLNLTKKLKEGVFLDSIDINLYIDELCENYKKLANIENSILEEKRIKDMEYIDENGKLHEGFHLQAITIKFKELTTLYNDGLRDTEKIQRLGLEIVKRSNIPYDRVLKEIPSDKLTIFYEMLIKSEKEVLCNDLKRYIKRNLFQFFQLIPSSIIEDNDKVDHAYNEYLNLVLDNPIQKNYLELIRKKSPTPQIINDSIFNLNDADIIEKIKKSMAEDEKVKVLESSLDIEILIEKYIKFKKSSNTVQKRQILSLGLFKEFLQGNGNEYKAKKLEDLTEEDVSNFEELITEATPRDEKHLKNKNLYQLVEYRKKTNGLRYSKNTLEMTDHDIKDFWKYISTKINKNLDSTLFSGFNSLYLSEYKKHEENSLDRKLRCFKNTELQNYIDVIFNEKDTKRILLSSPKNFYSFFFAFMYGLRIGEFSYIKMSDIRVQEVNNERVYYIWLNEDVKPQSLKNQNAHRNIPISSLMIKLGFLNYVEKRLKNKKEWLWDIPKSGYGTINTFHQRNIQKLFPEAADTKENKLRVLNENSTNATELNVIQFRCLRKNFSEFIFSKHLGEYYTGENAKRLMGHTEGTTSGEYLGRINPFEGKNILDNIDTYGLDFTNLLSYVKNFYGTILTDLSNLKDENNWMIKSYVKPKKGRKIK